VTACCGIDVAVFGHTTCELAQRRVGRSSMEYLAVNRPLAVQPLLPEPRRVPSFARGIIRRPISH
jgi:hypothetical protein